MPRYSGKRGRRIKKYKKSRKGCGRRGRRSIMREKTRKSKIFKKAKRHTLGKRRRMVGGLGCEGYSYRILDHIVKTYVTTKYKFTTFFQYNLTLIGFGIVLVTNANKGALFKAYNIPQQVAIFKDESGNIYIARGNYPIDTQVDYRENTVGVLKVNPETINCITLFEGNLPKSDKIDEKLAELECTGMPGYVTYMVSDEWGDNYRICVYESGVFTPECIVINKQHGTQTVAEAPTLTSNISTLFKNLEESTTKKIFIATLREVQYPKVYVPTKEETLQQLSKLQLPLGEPNPLKEVVNFPREMQPVSSR
jgi:hypothetical protein